MGHVLLGWLRTCGGVEGITSEEEVTSVVNGKVRRCSAIGPS